MCLGTRTPTAQSRSETNWCRKRYGLIEYPVLEKLLDGADGENEYERRQRGPATGGGHIGDLLQQRDEQEKTIRVPPELLEEEQRDERYETVDKDKRTALGNLYLWWERFKS